MKRTMTAAMRSATTKTEMTTPRRPMPRHAKPVDHCRSPGWSLSARRAASPCRTFRCRPWRVSGEVTPTLQQLLAAEDDDASPLLHGGDSPDRASASQRQRRRDSATLSAVAGSVVSMSHVQLATSPLAPGSSNDEDDGATPLLTASVRDPDGNRPLATSTGLDEAIASWSLHASTTPADQNPFSSMEASPKPPPPPPGEGKH
jgi:hypothetical protein